MSRFFRMFHVKHFAGWSYMGRDCESFLNVGQAPDAVQ